MTTRLALFSLLALSLAGPASAQGFGGFIKDKLKQEAKEKAGRAADQATDAAYEGGKKKAKGAPGEAATEKGEPAAADDAPRAGAPQKGGEAAPQAAQDEVAAGEVYGNKFDFIPGSKVLLFDDFVETYVGDYPARWTVKDGGGGNAVEVVSYKGRKWFKAQPADDGINQSSTHFLRYDPKGDMPKKFTIEFDADMGAPFTIIFNKYRGYGGREIEFDREQIKSEHVEAPVKPFGKVVKRVSVSVNGTYAKVYVGGTRILQDPDAVERPITRLGFRFDQTLGRGGSEDPDALQHQMFTNFRLAEGGKDVAQALNTDGRIVVHGIYFDTGSDVIRPESGGALRNILSLLQEDAALRFRIEGHTDDQGGPAVNGPLSDRRAAAVKAWLEAQGIDGKRLESRGLGATKPMDSNASQEGRANNRRVEFVRL
jgi:outer membrane protein OmpA-like peptidoglycan-associated protein